LLASLLLSGCAEMPTGLPLLGGVGTETSAAETGSCPTPEACAAELKKLVANPRRDWIGRPQSAEAYADGTRLFAYRALRRRLSCSELAGALEDTSAAAQLLQSPQHEQARTLTNAVARELKAEHTRRCRPTAEAAGRPR
jgi:hypothetical protein